MIFLFSRKYFQDWRGQQFIFLPLPALVHLTTLLMHDISLNDTSLTFPSKDTSHKVQQNTVRHFIANN